MTTDLGTLSGRSTQAFDLNDLGQVVGYDEINNYPYQSQPFLWSNGVMLGLSTLGGATSGAYGINNLGQIAGYSENAAGQPRAVLWTVSVAPPTPEEQIEALREQVTRLVAEGVLNAGQGNALLSKLDNALQKLGTDNPQIACNLLAAFRNQVKALLYAGVLPVDEAEELLDAVGEVRSQVCP